MTLGWVVVAERARCAISRSKIEIARRREGVMPRQIATQLVLARVFSSVEAAVG
jgi:hypothetical protein